MKEKFWMRAMFYTSGALFLASFLFFCWYRYDQLKTSAKAANEDIERIRHYKP